MIRIFTLMVLLAGCSTAHHDFGQHPPTTRNDCMNLFKSINEIQDQRHIYMDQMHKATYRFDNGKMSKKRYHKKREIWLDDEKHLRKLVGQLYDIGYEYRCF